VVESALATFQLGGTELMPIPNWHSESLLADATTPPGETGYPWLFFSGGRKWSVGLLVSLLVSSLGGAFYLWYVHSGNTTEPKGLVGLGYGAIGTIFLVLATSMYSLRRRMRKRALGQLHASLNWHMCFAVIGLAMILMHSFGQFKPISGTFALYGMVALTASGFMGRILDRLMSRLIAGEVAKVHTIQGEDRIASISQRVRAIVLHHAQEELPVLTVQAPDISPLAERAPGSKHDGAVANSPYTPWDVAYFSLEPMHQRLEQVASPYHLIPSKKSALKRPDLLLPVAQEDISSLQEVQRAMQRERLYRSVIRYWRVFHFSLVLLAIGLVTWHLIFAAQLLLPTILH
jgi:hypothetical protein